jgi:GTP-binding protein HflX
MLLVWNKIDVAPVGPRPVAAEKSNLVGSVRLSAATGEGVPALLDAIERWLDRNRVRLELAVPTARGDLLAWLHRGAKIVAERYEDGVARVTALTTPKMAGQIRKRLPELVCSTSPTH